MFLIRIRISSSFWPISNEFGRVCSHSHLLFTMNQPWLHENVVYDPYEEPDYPQPQEPALDRPQFIFRYDLTFVDIVAQKLIEQFGYIPLRRNLGF